MHPPCSCQPNGGCTVFHQAIETACTYLCMLKCFVVMAIVLIKVSDDSNQQSCMLQAQVRHLPFSWQAKDEHVACGLCYTSGTTGNPKVRCTIHACHHTFTAYLAIHSCMSMLMCQQVSASDISSNSLTTKCGGYKSWKSSVRFLNMGDLSLSSISATYAKSKSMQSCLSLSWVNIHPTP